MIAVVVAPLVGMQATALAQETAYPPSRGTLSLSDSTLGPGEAFTATLAGCTPGETVNFVLDDSDADDDGATVTAVCDASGNASASITAPMAAGTYTITATGVTSGVTATTTFTVTAAAPGDDGDDGGAAPTLPETGSDSMPIAQIGGGVLLAGLGLGAVAWRRRQPSMA